MLHAARRASRPAGSEVFQLPPPNVGDLIRIARSGFLASINASNFAGHFRNRNMTDNENKIECMDSLIFGLNRTAEWRKKMAVRHPSDNRNTRANSYLMKLANEASQLSDEDFLQLEPYCALNEPWRDCVSKAARHVGFTHKIKDFPSFVEHLLEVLNEPIVS